MALVCFSVPVFAGLFSDPDPDWKEGDYTMPAAPRDLNLREFFVSSASPNRFLIDEESLAVSDDGVVRYVLVVRTPGGASNVTFEGIRCATGAWRIYATGRAGGEWSAARDANWQPIVDTTYNRVRAALAKDHFCDGPVPPRNRDEVLLRLRSTASRYGPSGN
ncbi:CNP1-like family protein [Aromatoleum diolicum]|uniref:CNP1-like family protein n=1 Tax=Aromatoleum diolicum TaxID=75796 RepID=UPI003CCD34C6